MNVLNNGYVKLIEHMGGDKAVIRNARRCWRSEDKSSEKSDKNLIRHLLREGHMTPFEAMVFTFDIKCPIFVARQWMRHRHASINEESMRYCATEGEFYNPFDIKDARDTTQWHVWANYNHHSFKAYEYMLEKGMSKEQARSILPLGTYTKFYWTVNGSSLINFLNLRTDESAQKEIRDYAKAIYQQVKEVAPITFETWNSLREITTTEGKI